MTTPQNNKENTVEEIAQKIQDRFFDKGAKINIHDWEFLKSTLFLYGQSMKEEGYKEGRKQGQLEEPHDITKD